MTALGVALWILVIVLLGMGLPLLAALVAGVAIGRTITLIAYRSEHRVGKRYW